MLAPRLCSIPAGQFSLAVPDSVTQARIQGAVGRELGGHPGTAGSSANSRLLRLRSPGAWVCAPEAAELGLEADWEGQDLESCSSGAALSWGGAGATRAGGRGEWSGVLSGGEPRPGLPRSERRAGHIPGRGAGLKWPS